jgi:hypothetical protein
MKKISRDLAYGFLAALQKETRQRANKKLDIKVCIQDAVDPVAQSVLMFAYNEAASSHDKTCRLSSAHIANLCLTKRYWVRKAVEGLARVGILHVLNGWKNDGSKERLPWQITINPLVIATIGSGSRPVERRATIAHLADLAIARTVLDWKVQGFEYDCKFGSEELVPPDEIEVSTTDKLLSMIEGATEADLVKARERERWAKLNEAFVNGCATIWSTHQGARGFGYVEPNWKGSPGGLAPAARKERTELTKTFQQYGGAITGILWELYCSYEHSYDKNGKLVYDVDRPHQQYTTTDKKPSQFAKHFNALLRDPITLVRFTDEYQHRYEKLKPLFKDAIDAQPLDGSLPSIKLGYELGSSGSNLGQLSQQQ